MLVSKENLGCVILLLLVIVLSLSKSLHIFIDTHLGRIILILFVLILSYLNKILGVVFALFIIIIMSGNNMIYQEGFDTNTINKETTKTDTSKTNVSKDIQKEKEKEEVQKGDNTVNITTNSNIPNPTNITSPTSSISQTELPSHDSSAITSSIASSTTTEGFDIIGLENDIKKGKQSNSIPVNAFMKESQFVSAYEPNPFKVEFTNF